jgi:hypothetical protein
LSLLAGDDDVCGVSLSKFNDVFVVDLSRMIERDSEYMKLLEGDGKPDPFRQALDKCRNKAVCEFFAGEWAGRGRRTKFAIRFDLVPARGWYVSPRDEWAYIVQKGRFSGDEALWRSRISDPASIHTKRGGADLSFNLHSAEDFGRFREILEAQARERRAG